MKYFGQGEDYITGECEVCGKVLKISKSICIKEDNKYSITEQIKCKCGNESAEIIIPEPKPLANPKKKGFWENFKIDLKSGLKEEANKQIAKADAIKQRKLELDAQGIAYCPKCLSTSLSANKKGFGVGKAVVGATLTLGVGILAGGIGRNKIEITCLKCGYKFKPGK